MGPWPNGSPLVQSQNIGVAMLAQGGPTVGLTRVKPGSGADLYNSWSDMVADYGTAQAGPPGVEYPNQITIHDPPVLCIIRMQHYRLASMDFCGAALRAVIQL